MPTDPSDRSAPDPLRERPAAGRSPHGDRSGARAGKGAARTPRARAASSGAPGPSPGTPGGGDLADADLIRATLDGDQDAFALLMGRYQKRAFWVAFHLLGRTEDARDVVQEAFIRVFRSLEKFDHSRSFYTWLYRIVTNLAIDSLRKHRPGRSVELAPEADVADGREGPRASAEAEERRLLVRRVVETLPAKFRTVLVLRDLEGLSCREIAPIMKISHTTVRWRLHRARHMFKERWNRLTRERDA